MATVVGMSAAVTSFSAAVRFCVWLLMTLEALCNRLTVDPILPRRAATEATALLMSARAAVASDWVNRSLTDPAAPPVKVAAPKVLAVPVSELAMLLLARPLVKEASVRVASPPAAVPVVAVTEVLTVVLLGRSSPNHFHR